MEYKIIDVIRHGEAYPNRGPARQYDERASLSEQGKMQAAKLAEFYKTHGVALDHIISSPLRRAKETANPLPKKHWYRRIQKHSGLSEPRWGNNIWGQLLSDLPEHPNGAGNNLYHTSLRGQEPYDKVATRTKEAAERLLSVTRPGEITAAVCHGSIARLLESHFRKPDFLPASESDIIEYGLLPNAGIRRFVFDENNQLICVISFSEERTVASRVIFDYSSITTGSTRGLRLR